MLFSIVIPAKNEERNISFCLDALQSLQFPREEFEIIVVDNGSTDSTVSIVQNYGIRVFIQPQLSLSGLRNFGAGVAKGDNLVFLDADCIPDANWLKIAALTLADANIGCTGSTPVAPAHGTWVERVWSSFRTRRTNKCSASWINSSNFFVRKKLFDKVGGFNDRVKTCEDVDICMRLAETCTLIFDPTVKVVHLGEPKTIREFLHKEIWRGKGTMSGIISHGIKRSEIKSLLLPLYYVLLPFCILWTLPSLNYTLLLVLLFLYVLPAMIFSAWNIFLTRKYSYMFGYLILFILYANARSLALFLR